jgi:hypothetical protein
MASPYLRGIVLQRHRMEKDSNKNQTTGSGIRKPNQPSAWDEALHL